MKHPVFLHQRFMIILTLWGKSLFRLLISLPQDLAGDSLSLAFHLLHLLLCRSCFPLIPLTSFFIILHLFKGL